ncbi:MAG TPA: hypothetical protein VF470_08015, partial [Sphingomicrobium sp.]
ARLAAGSLTLNEASDLAVNLRMMKHVNPVLGVISAYLYDAVGDVDSIRRMAYFYVHHNQAIPFDIAFLADLGTQGSADGSLRAEVPALGERRPRTRNEGAVPWTTAATLKVEGPVAGRMPWMRQGWPHVASPTRAERMMMGEVLRVMPRLTSSRFTTFDRDGGTQAARLLQLEEQS